jgi:hypothetical protein
MESNLAERILRHRRIPQLCRALGNAMCDGAKTRLELTGKQALDGVDHATSPVCCVLGVKTNAANFNATDYNAGKVLVGQRRFCDCS